MRTLILFLLLYPFLLWGQSNNQLTLADTATAQDYISEANTLINEANFKSTQPVLSKAINIYRSLCQDGKNPKVCMEYIDLLTSVGRKATTYYEFDFADSCLIEAKNFVESAYPDDHRLGRIYWFLGILERNKDLPQEALKYYQKAKILYHKQDGFNSTGVFQVCNSIGNLYLDLNIPDSAQLYFSITTNGFKEITSNPQDSSVLARALHGLGGCEMMRDNFDSALEYYQKALQIRENINGKLNEDVAGTLSQLGSVLLKMDSFDVALEYYQKETEIRSRIFGPTHPLLARSFNRIGNINTVLGQYEEAINAYQNAIRADSSIGLAGLATVYYYKGNFKKSVYYDEKALSYFQNNPTLLENIASGYAELGDYKKAEHFFQRALKLRILKVGELHSDVGMNYIGQGTLSERIGDNKNALRYYEKAMKIFSVAYDSISTPMAKAYLNVGIVYSKMKDYDKGIFYLKKSCEIRKSSLGSNHPDYGNARLALAQIYFIKGEEFKVIKNLELAKEVFESNFGNKHPYLSKVYMLKSGIHKSRGEFEKAAKNIQKSICAVANNFDSEDVFDNPEIEANSPNSFQLITPLMEKANILNLLFKDSKNPRFSNSARETSMLVIDIIDNIRKGFYYSESKEIIQEKTQSVFEIGLRSFILSSNDKALMKDGFSLSEKAKSIVLLESLKENEAISFGNIPNSLIDKEYDLRTDITYYDKKRREKITSGLEETDTTVLSISSKLFDLNREYEALKDTLEQNHPEYYRLKYDFSTISVEEVQTELLSPTQTLLEYFVGDSSIFVFIVNQEDYQVFEIKKDFPLEAWVDTFRMANSQEGYDSRILEYCRVGAKLYEKLVAPVDDLLKQEVIIVPDGVLGYLPFEALLVEPVEDGKYTRFKNYHYWLKDKQISYCYSATLLREMKEKQHKREATKGIMAIAPYYDGDTTMLASLLRYADPEDKEPLRPLKHSGEEVYGIQKLVGGDVFYQETATEDNFTEKAGDYRILHLATHGKANDKVGDYSFLAFTEQKDSIENELLYVRDLYNLQLNADMVVLSACETGIGELRRGEGIISLARGFTYAGAKSIITSLWSVEDASTKDLMLLFYKHLKKGLPKDKALQQAKLDYISKADHFEAHPFFWSGFIGIGDMKEVEF